VFLAMRPVPLAFAVVLALAPYARLEAQGEVPAEGTLTFESLGAMIAGLGYTTAPKEGYHEVTISRGGIDLRVGLSLSGNMQRVWMSVYVAELPAAEKIPADWLYNLLTRADDIRPVHFFTRPKTALYMGLSIDNRAMTPAVLRRDFDWFVDTVVAAKDIWSVKLVGTGTPSGG
jgi:hypothetical protein